MRERKFIYVIVGCTLVLVFALACGISFDAGGDQNEAINLQMTQQSLQLTQEALSNKQDNTVASVEPIDEQDDSESEEEVDEMPCHRSRIVSETISDGTEFAPGVSFEKTWTLRNAGDCDWTTSYYFKFVEGDRMDGTSSLAVQSLVKPNEQVTFKLDLKAPNDPGDYTGVWQLFAANGEGMGRYWVKITVPGAAASPPVSFAVTSVSTNLTNLDGVDCNPPYVHPVQIHITANGSGSVTYNTERSTSGVGPTKTMVFDAAGTKVLDTSWEFDHLGAIDYWLIVNIQSPNNQTFGPFEFWVDCDP